MQPSRLALLCSLSMLAAAPACQSKSAPGPETKAGDAKTPDAKTAPVGKTADPAATPSADDGPSPGEIAAVEASRGQGSPPATASEPDKALGAQFADPRWFRKTMFGDSAKVLDTKRSQADNQGRFSSLIRFELPDMKLEACTDHLETLVKDDISDLQREDKGVGRVQLTGATDRYKVTFVCGENEGKTIAYVSYQWL